MKTTLIFGSKTDEKVYTPLIEKLKQKKIKFELKILSAHKTPKELEKLLKNTKTNLFISGAGLSAALPGVIASQTIKPVIGIPCKGAYQGTDALLSIHQMPPGIPVIGVGIEQTKNAIELTDKYLNKKINSINLVKGKTKKEKELFEKTKKHLQELKIKFKEIEFKEIQKQKNSINLVIKEVNKLNELNKTKQLLLVCPVTNKDTVKNIEKIFNATKKHYWVGLNNYKNLAIAGIELINTHNEFDEMLKKEREKARKKVLNANK